LAVPPAAIIGILSIGITIGWAYYAARLLALSRKGAFESSWRNIAVGAIATAVGIAILTAADYIGAFWAGIAGSSMIAVGGAFMFLALISQYSIWKRMMSSEDSKKILQSFIASPVTAPQAKPAPPREEGPMGIPEGARTILEFDPKSDYESYVTGVVKNALRDGSTVALFTRQGSVLSRLAGVKLVLLSFSEESVKLGPDGALTVSMTNPSLILDAFDSVTKSGERVEVVVDSLTDLVLNIGFERTYNLLQRMSEAIAGSRAGLLLLLNAKAHDERTAAALEGYGTSILRYDGTGLHSQKVEQVRSGD
jgi:hypothetical protein